MGVMCDGEEGGGEGEGDKASHMLAGLVLASGTLEPTELVLTFMNRVKEAVCQWLR